MAEYTSVLYSLVTRSEIPWYVAILISMYCQGLNLEIATGVASPKLLLLVDADQVSKQMENNWIRYHA